MELRPIKKEDYELLLELDRKVYPTDDPVTPNILDNWFAKNPEFGMIYENEGIDAISIVIPLNKKGWDGLTSGDLSEADMKDDLIYDGKNNIYLHVYHIEKLKNVNKF